MTCRFRRSLRWVLAERRFAGPAPGLGTGPGPPGCTGSCVSVAEPETSRFDRQVGRRDRRGTAAPDATIRAAVGAVFVVVWSGRPAGPGSVEEKRTSSSSTGTPSFVGHPGRGRGGRPAVGEQRRQRQGHLGTHRGPRARPAAKGRRSASAWIVRPVLRVRGPREPSSFPPCSCRSGWRSSAGRLRLRGSAGRFVRSGAAEARGSRQPAFHLPGPVRRTAAASSASRTRMRAGRPRSRLRLRRRRSRCLRRGVRETRPVERDRAQLRPRRAGGGVFRAEADLGATALDLGAGGLFVESHTPGEGDFRGFEIRGRRHGRALGLGDIEGEVDAGLRVNLLPWSARPKTEGLKESWLHPVEVEEFHRFARRLFGVLVRRHGKAVELPTEAIGGVLGQTPSRRGSG